MKDCPACMREFKRIDDFPLVYVADFKRGDIPTEVKFPVERDGDYVNPESELGNKRAPDEVVSFFRENEKADKFEYEGWRWTKGGAHDGSQFYNRSNADSREIMLASIAPYLNRLESLVGQEVPTSEALPSFHGDENGFYRMPVDFFTGYHLRVRESNEREGTIGEDEGKEAVDKLGLRKVILEVIEFGEGIMAHGAIPPPIEILAVVGTLKYEGRVKDHKR